ncbi:MAG: hypothetical protein ACK4R6_12495 [Spirosomataceae bacterium]
MLYLLFGVCALLFTSSSGYAQSIDFTNLKNKKILKVTGGLNVNTLYNSYVPVATNKLSYFVNGTVQFDFLGLLSIPLNLNYSNRKFNYSQPFSFNQFSISPRYKWATAHAGTSSLTFSPYTLNGHQFQGGGLELSPSNWQISLMAGKLIRSTNDSTFSRNGVGAKVVYKPGKYHVGMSVFHAADNPMSVTPERQEGLQTIPQKNWVLSFEGGYNSPKFGQLEAEVATSFISQNRVLEIGEPMREGIARIFFRSNAPIESKVAVKTKYSKPFNKGKTLVGVGYERVDPGYRTFGGYFFTNDFENYTVHFTQRLLGNKLAVSGNVGNQRDLLETKANGQNRFVVSSRVTYMPSPKLNINAGYSNFRGFVFIRDLIQEVKRESSFIPIDTLNYTQINRNTNVTMTYSVRQTEKSTQMLNLTGSILEGASKQGEFIRTGQTSRVINLQGGYSLNMLASNTSFSLGYNLNNNKIAAQQSVAHGPTMILQQGFLGGKAQVSSSSTLLLTNTSGGIFTESLTASYRVSAKSNIQGTFLLMNNPASKQGGEVGPNQALPSTIVTTTIGYIFKF